MKLYHPRYVRYLELKIDRIEKVIELLLMGDNPDKLSRYWIYEKIKEIKEICEEK